MEQISGPGAYQEKSEKIRFFEWLGSDSCVLKSAPYHFKLTLNKRNLKPEARRETYRLARSQYVVGPVAARALSCAAYGDGERALRSDSTYAQLVDML